LELCQASTPDSKPLPKDDGFIKRLDVDFMSGGFYLTVPEEALRDISEDDRYYKERGGKIGLKIAKNPHIFWSTTFAAYSDIDFILPKPQIGLSAPAQDADYLRAVSLYLNSSIVKYLLFFHAASWGIDRSKFAPADAEDIPIPDFSEEQVKQLADLHRELSEAQLSGTDDSLFDSDTRLLKMKPTDIKTKLDNQVEKILKLPEYFGILARDFMRVRHQFVHGKAAGTAAQSPTKKDLLNYAKYLTQELDGFA
jgi:hypothetical protein